MRIDYKSLLVPVVAVLCLLYQAVTGHAVAVAIKDNITNQLAAFITFAVTVYGIWKTHRKEVKTNDAQPK